MPYKSEAQRAKFHAMLDRGEIDPETVHEFDEASRGMRLPKRIHRKKTTVERYDEERDYED